MTFLPFSLLFIALRRGRTCKSENVDSIYRGDKNERLTFTQCTPAMRSFSGTCRSFLRSLSLLSLFLYIPSLFFLPLRSLSSPFASYINFLFHFVFLFYLFFFTFFLFFFSVFLSSPSSTFSFSSYFLSLFSVSFRLFSYLFITFSSGNLSSLCLLFFVSSRLP